MTKKFFLVTVELPDADVLSADDEYLRGEIEQFSEALIQYHARAGAPVVVTCSIIEPDEAFNALLRDMQ